MKVYKVFEKQNFLPAAIVSIGFVTAFYPVWVNLISAWYQSDDYSHGFLMGPIGFFIIWYKRDNLAKIPVETSWAAFGLIVFALALYLISFFGEITTLASLSMILFIGSAIAFLFGWRIFFELIFPLSILLFMIPVPAQILSMLTIPLQLFVSEASAAIASMIGVPIYLEGNVIHLPMRTLQVVQACSGLRSMVSLIALSSIAGYFFLKSNGLRALLIVNSVPTAVFVNIVRVFIMIICFHYFQLDLTEGSVHTLFGVFIFFLALAVIAFTYWVLSKWDISAKQS